jgi:hypothetical protein
MIQLPVFRISSGIDRRERYGINHIREILDSQAEVCGSIDHFVFGEGNFGQRTPPLFPEEGS